MDNNDIIDFGDRMLAIDEYYREEVEKMEIEKMEIEIPENPLFKEWREKFKELEDRIKNLEEMHADNVYMKLQD